MYSFYDKLAVYYDILYIDKDYEKECDFLEELFKSFATKPVKDVLDIGCGTGGHTLVLAKRGYRMTGIDISQQMIDKARHKVSKAGLKVPFYTADMKNFNLDAKFDACICMFAGISYLGSYKELQRAFMSIRRHLRKDGLFIFDFWNGTAVIAQRPSTRVRIANVNSKGRIIRIATPEVSYGDQVCKVNYHGIVMQNNFVVDEFEEIHNFRFFFPAEMKTYLQENGFTVLKMCPTLNLNSPPNEVDWYLTVVARRID